MMGATAVVTLCTLAIAPAASQTTTYKATRTPDGKPNLNGIWQALNTANWDLEGHAERPSLVVALGAVGAEPGGLGVVEGGEIPYLPAAKAKKKENFENRLTAEGALLHERAHEGGGDPARRPVGIGRHARAGRPAGDC